MNHNLLDVLVISGGKCGSTTLKNTFIKNGYKCDKYHSNADFKKRNKGNIFNFIKKISTHNKIIIIDSYRLPIERKISSFFENLHNYLGKYENLSIQYLTNYFNQNCIMNIEEYHSINCILDYFKLPRFKSFDFKKRYNIYEKDNKILIKILFRDIENWDKILSEIFNKEIVIKSANVSKNKEYYDLYKKFIEKYKVPKDTLKRY